jgi:chemotaxis protein CheD
MLAADYQEVFASHFYHDKTFDSPAVKVFPGEYHVSTEGRLIVTVLGSCVAACIRDRKAGFGGMNHFMLPDAGESESSVVGSAARYGSYAMEILINHLLKLGAARQNLEAKIFGGGNVLSGMTVGNVGPRNAQFVKEYLAMERIPVVAEDLLGQEARKVYFFSHTGRVMVKTIREQTKPAVVDREMRYQKRIVVRPISGDAELF